MDFRTTATKDLSAVLDRLIQAADAAAQAARDEAAAAAQVAIDAVSAQRAAVQQALREQVDARNALQQALQEQVDARDALQKANTALDAEQARLTDEAGRLRARIEALQVEWTALQDQLHALRDHSDALQAQSDAREAESNTLQAQSDARAAESNALRQDLDAARREVESTQTASEALLAESNAAQQALQDKLDAALRDAVETTARATERRTEEARTIRDQAVALVSRTLDRMLAVTAALATVSTEDDVLAAVVEALATEFPRVVLFKVALDRLDVVQHVGFEFPSDYTHLVVPHAIGAVLDRAVTSGQIEMLSAEAVASTSGTPFGGTPACALALPIDLAGDMCAVLYADDSGQARHAFAAAELRRTFAMLLRQLAAPLLQRLPAEMKAITELRAYAAHLVAELENMYDADVAARRKGSDLRRRLHDNLECARGIYAQRVSSELPAAAGLLEAELVLAASVAHATPFGRDLTTLLGAPEPRVAEA